MIQTVSNKNILLLKYPITKPLLYLALTILAWIVMPLQIPLHFLDEDVKTAILLNKIIELFFDPKILPFLLVYILLCFFGGLVSTYFYFAAIRARLWLSNSGIIYVSHLPIFLQGWIPSLSPRDFSVSWKDISTLQLSFCKQSIAPSPSVVTLKIITKSSSFELFPCQWISLKDKQFQQCHMVHSTALWQKFTATEISQIKEVIIEQILQSPLMKYIGTNNTLPHQNINSLSINSEDINQIILNRKIALRFGIVWGLLTVIIYYFIRQI